MVLFLELLLRADVSTEGVVRKYKHLPRGVDFGESPGLEATFEAVEIGLAFKEFGEHGLHELFLVGDAE
jgi:hypothetical protein